MKRTVWSVALIMVIAAGWRWSAAGSLLKGGAPPPPALVHQVENIGKTEGHVISVELK